MTCLTVTCAAALGCGKPAGPPPGPAFSIAGESARLRLEDAWPATSPWFDGTRVSLAGARGETLGIQVLDRAGESVSLAISGTDVQVRGYAVDTPRVTRSSTVLYGGSHGEGAYPDGLRASEHPGGIVTYFEIVIGRDAAAGAHAGTLKVGARERPVTLDVAAVKLPPLDVSRVWAYEDPREFTWYAQPSAQDIDRAVPSDAEKQCIALFREYGVLLSPDLDLAWWPARKDLLVGAHDIPVVIPADPVADRDKIATAVRGWIDATRGTGQVPFAIPVDEPSDAPERKSVAAIGKIVREAGGGPQTFRLAVTAPTSIDFEGQVDLFISWNAVHLGDEPTHRWTYNGAPPYAGSMVLDAAAPGPRTWGWIAWRWNVATWYVWDALYWHDRYNRDGQPLPGRHLDPDASPVSFDDGEDHGNLDGVLALPDAAHALRGCRPTLRLAAIRRGYQDAQLLDAAKRCDAAATDKIASDLIPVALGNATAHAKPSWPLDDVAFETARRKLLALASCQAAAPVP